MKNVRTHRDIKLVTTERRTNYLVSDYPKLSYYKVFYRISISSRNEKNADTYELTCLIWTFNTRTK